MTARHPASSSVLTLWLANRRDVDPVDYCIWGMMQELVYHVPIRHTDDLRQRLVEFQTWANIQHSVVNDAIVHWRKRLEACTC